MSSPARAEGDDTPAQQRNLRKDLTTFMVAKVSYDLMLRIVFSASDSAQIGE